MKIKLFFYINVFVILFGVVGCSKSNSDDKAEIRVTNFISSGCKGGVNVTGDTDFLDNQEYIEYEGKGNGRLCIKHVNAIFSCEQEKIVVSVLSAEDKIIINEEEIGASANCLGLFDLTYDIACLKVGEHYTLVIGRGEYETIRFSFEYDNSIKGKLLIER